VTNLLQFDSPVPPDVTPGNLCELPTMLGVPIGEQAGSSILPYLARYPRPTGSATVLPDVPLAQGALLAVGSARTSRLLILIDHGVHG
jgi:hypothetical protein